MPIPTTETLRILVEERGYDLLKSTKAALEGATLVVDNTSHSMPEFKLAFGDRNGTECVERAAESLGRQFPVNAAHPTPKSRSIPDGVPGSLDQIFHTPFRGKPRAFPVLPIPDWLGERLSLKKDALGIKEITAPDAGRKLAEIYGAGRAVAE